MYTICFTWSSRSRHRRRTRLPCSPSAWPDRKLWPGFILLLSFLSESFFYFHYHLFYHHLVAKTTGIHLVSKFRLVWNWSPGFSFGYKTRLLRFGFKMMIWIRSIGFCDYHSVEHWIFERSPSHSGHPIEQPLENQKHACKKRNTSDYSSFSSIWIVSIYVDLKSKGGGNTCPLEPVSAVPLDTGHLEHNIMSIFHLWTFLLIPKARGKTNQASTPGRGLGTGPDQGGNSLSTLSISKYA